MKSISLRILALVLISLSIGPAAFSRSAELPLFFTPTASAQVDVMAGINGAKSSIHMLMFRLTEPKIIDALIAAKARGVDVQIILDSNSLAKEKPGGPSQVLGAGGVTVIKSSSQFSISHYKSFVVDGSMAYIMTMNLTRIADRVRDVGYMTADAEAVAFVEELFKVDADNAANNSMNSPTKIPANMVISPVNSKERLSSLIKSAKTDLKVVVENLSYTDLIQDMIDAKARGVDVQVMLPRCNISNADFDLPAAKTLSDAGVNVRMMPPPDSVDLPYLHQKSMMIDGAKGFLGSENFSFNSIEKARELGLIFDDASQVGQMTKIFMQDFDKSVSYTDAAKITCPARTFSADAGL